ncbi:metal-sensitive transcriptional regulator [Kitasatospora sp. RG8]|uniref:metal-sensitive transcriptional regulator n=1 Tax=Kitasatospora sp. RG8 TaxID=2820815 RepID=UPI0027385105|nr:metal-sensitive transcriptional regulator [Kitasatospora sp. RG8]
MTRYPLGVSTADTEAPTRLPEEARMAGYHDDKDQVMRRLRRIEGQVRGLQRMVDADDYCIDVLTQVSATTKALQSVALQLLDSHLGHCVQDAIARGGGEADAKVAEASNAIARLMRA